MTEAEQRIYARMSPREQRAIDALSESLRPAALAVWARTEGRTRRRQSTRLQPDRTTLAPADFQDGSFPDESERRFP
jgi:hypothetical protein